MNGAEGPGWMMSGMTAVWILIVAVLILDVIALIKYLRSK